MIDMNQTEYNQILKIIKRDINNNDLEHNKKQYLMILNWKAKKRFC